jgi:hypothetical protein
LNKMIQNFNTEKFFESYSYTSEPVKFLTNSMQKPEGDHINLLLNQLNELESILQSTKNQLFNYDTKFLFNNEAKKYEDNVDGLFKFEM